MIEHVTKFTYILSNCVIFFFLFRNSYRNKNFVKKSKQKLFEMMIICNKRLAQPRKKLQKISLDCVFLQKKKSKSPNFSLTKLMSVRLLKRLYFLLCVSVIFLLAITVLFYSKFSLAQTPS